MNVLFDVWALYENDHVYTDLEERMFESIYNYIHDRILILDNEIEKEEISNKDAAILVYLCTDPKAILPKGYSEKLTNRILGCFNENDVSLLWQSVENDVKTMLN